MQRNLTCHKMQLVTVRENEKCFLMYQIGIISLIFVHPFRPPDVARRPRFILACNSSEVLKLCSLGLISVLLLWGASSQNKLQP